MTLFHSSSTLKHKAALEENPGSVLIGGDPARHNRRATTSSLPLEGPRPLSWAASLAESAPGRRPTET